MIEPVASRPYMPGYGVAGPDEPDGLLTWAWAREQLTATRNYWLATVWPDGRPHAMPVWGVLDGDDLWFSCGGRSRKRRNLAADPRCVVTSEDTDQPVVMEGVARLVTDPESLRRFLDLMNAKYDASYSLDFLDPAVNATFAVRPVWAFGLRHDDFAGSPTRWRFPEPETGSAV